MAEWLGRGLQNLLHRFESGSDLNKKSLIREYRAFFVSSASELAQGRQEYKKIEAEKQLRLFWLKGPLFRITD